MNQYHFSQKDNKRSELKKSDTSDSVVLEETGQSTSSPHAEILYRRGKDDFDMIKMNVIGTDIEGLYFQLQDLVSQDVERKEFLTTILMQENIKKRLKYYCDYRDRVLKGVSLSDLDFSEQVDEFIETNLSKTQPTEIREAGSTLESKPILTSYINLAISKAKIEKLNDGTYYAEISECPGVWANEETQETCILILREVLEEWIVFKLLDNDPISVIDGIEIGKVVEESCDP